MLKRTAHKKSGTGQKKRSEEDLLLQMEKILNMGFPKCPGAGANPSTKGSWLWAAVKTF